MWLVQWAARIVEPVQPSSQIQHRVAIVASQGRVHLTDDLDVCQLIVDALAGRIQQCCHCLAEQVARRTRRARSTLVVQCIQECVVLAVPIQVELAVAEERAGVEHVLDQIRGLIRRP